MNYNQALEIAKDITSGLHKFTHIAKIAGSVRREKSEPKDIEIVCAPHYVDGAQGGLFSDVRPAQVISPNFTAYVAKLGKVLKGKPDGRYMQIELRQRVNLDLFMPDPVDFWRQFVIRTGSADYVRSTITVAWLKKGWCGSDQGLRLITDCEASVDTLSGKRSWKCLNPDGERPPVWESESDVLNWLGIDWIMPKLRTI